MSGAPRPEHVARWMPTLTVILLLTAGTVAAAENDTVPSELRVALTIVGGKPRVDRARSVFPRRERDNPSSTAPEPNPTAAFTRGLAIPRQRAITALFDDLDRVFGSLPPLFHFAVASDEVASALTDAATNTVRTVTGTWEEFRVTAFDPWQRRHPARRPIKDALRSYMKAVDTELRRRTSMFFDDADADAYTAEGTLKLGVGDPIGDVRVLTPSADGGESVDASEADRAEVVRVLRPLRGQLWRAQMIKSRLEEYYAELGLVVEVNVSDADARPRDGGLRTVEVRKKRLGRIIFPRPRVLADIEPALYVLLPTRAWRAFIADPDARVTPLNGGDASAGEELVALDVGALSERAETPYLNVFTFQVQQLQVAALGFGIELQGVKERAAHADVRLRRLVGAGGDRKKTATRAFVPVPDPRGHVDPNPVRPERQLEFTPPQPPIRPPDEVAAPDRERRNYLAGGLEYRPGQGARVFGLYEHAQLGGGDLAVKLGVQDEPFGSIAYAADYVAFAQLRRRLSLQITGGSDFQNERILAGTRTDERRNGGLARAELELFRDLDGSLLRLHTEARGENVVLDRDGHADHRSLTMLEVGALYAFETVGAPHALRARAEPRTRIGLGLAPDDPSFVTARFDAGLHRKLGAGFELEIAGRLEVASGSTPVFELPSLGGPETLRAFRRDAALGRRLAALQGELWCAVPGIANRDDVVSTTLRRHVRLASFVDVAAIDDTVDSKAGVRVGPGVGVRVIWFPVVLKLDWAYGFGERPAAGGRSNVSLGVGTSIPF